MRRAMRPLLPTLKERKRYVVYQILTSKPLGKDVSRMILHRLTDILGVFGAAEAGLLQVSYDTTKQQGILRTDNKHVNKVKAALTMVTHIGKTRVLIQTKGVSGILAKTKRFTEE
ncbi:hypothetical protein GOV11_01755 [Candidatus Woesearchaeota archaeon]|nr:hypothetical protein [Candidatus Woesearchaeota archaeon]